ncbi:MAG TPA: hypothetical protein VFT01_09250 [Homoserinimonas sp.]|nr:hypothetical protein [Homoserinimonas sp.]
MPSAEFSITVAPSLCGNLRFDLNPYGEIERSLKLRVEQSNAVDDQHTDVGQRLWLSQAPGAPVEPLERARLPSTKWGDNLPQKAKAVYTFPVSGAVMGTFRIQEVIAPNSSGSVNAQQQVPGESGFSGARVP